MTDEQRKVQEEVTSAVLKKCAGRERCKGCPHYSEGEEYLYDCWGKEAVRLIIEARKAQTQ